MFAPDQRAAAAELARVTRPGGRLALLAWHPSRGVAELFKVMAAHMPPPPEGVGDPFAWATRTISPICSAMRSSFATRGRLPAAGRLRRRGLGALCQRLWADEGAR
jgi:hypothetical protein